MGNFLEQGKDTLCRWCTRRERGEPSPPSWMDEVPDGHYALPLDFAGVNNTEQSTEFGVSLQQQKRPSSQVQAKDT